MTTVVVIPNWNGLVLLERNLPAVMKLKADEIIVVDDCSSDESVAFLEKNYPQVILIKNEKNLGFSRSVNKGVLAASSDIVFLLNSDVIPSLGIVKPVLAHFKKPDVFGVSFAEVGYSWAKPKLTHGYLGHESGEKTNKAHDTFWVSGGSGAFRRSMWLELGGMDTLFTPFYWEDVDLSLRALKKGWKLIWEPKAIVEHKHESTINTTYFSRRYLHYIKERNELLFNWKYLDKKYLFRQHFPGIIWRLKHPGYLIVLLLALSKLPFVLRQRVLVRQESFLSIKDVLLKFGVKC
ncbi:MAG: glycosyltransferase family 2 protein [Candidatus Blackburnbacteria bacterium]|nr:glycosyltransferase family 2 protein [Candidatus Blackburnbacteria bacterium]